MGLFKNDKKPCPICGSATPRLLATKIEGQPICSDCDRRISMETEIQNNLTLAGLRQHYAWRDANDAEKEAFSPSLDLSASWSDDIVLDQEHRAFSFYTSKYDVLFHADEVRLLTIREDGRVLFSGGPQGGEWRYSSLPERVSGMAGQIDVALMMDRICDMADDDRSNDHRNDPYFSDPMDHWTIELRLEHPYWNILEMRINAPYWDNRRPDCGCYLQEYEERIVWLQDFAQAMMGLCFPEAVGKDKGEADVQVSPVSEKQLSSAESTIEELKKYKELFDAGVINEDEFSAKKRQLLGI